MNTGIGKWLWIVKARGLFWFRVFGYGLLFRDTRKSYQLFSERNRLRPMVTFGPFVIRLLGRAE